MTINTYKTLPIFGRIEGGKIQLNELGNLALQCWKALPDHFDQVELDAFIVMPNHVHGIIVIKEIAAGPYPNSATINSRAVGATHASPLRKDRQPHGPKRDSLASIIGSYKSAVTKEINYLGLSQNKVWHRNYYEHIIRDDQDLENIRRYILYNAAK